MAVTTRIAPNPVAHDLDRTVEVIEDAAAAIDEMLRYNRAMKSVAAQGVSHYRAEADEARREAAALARQVAQMKSEKQAIADDYESRIEELEQRLAQQERELESMRSLLWPGGRGPR
jgi:nitrate/nitrite-specific signal transduction histidine kinase